MFLAGLLATVGLVAIYLFRTRYRRQVVSSLMFWNDQLQPMTGGRRLERFRMPLLFLLELLVLLLLCLAAAKPMIQKDRDLQRVIVVLDDSVSMRAGGDSDSPPSAGFAGIKLEFPDERNYVVRYLTAGSSVQPVRVSDKTFSQWNCLSFESKLDEAVGLAIEMDPEAKILVVSDHLPKDYDENGRVRWWAFGHPKENFGLVNARRFSVGSHDRYLVEILRSGTESKGTKLTISSGDQLIKRWPLTLKRVKILAGLFLICPRPRPTFECRYHRIRWRMITKLLCLRTGGVRYGSKIVSRSPPCGKL